MSAKKIAKQLIGREVVRVQRDIRGNIAHRATMRGRVLNVYDVRGRKVPSVIVLWSSGSRSTHPLTLLELATAQ